MSATSLTGGRVRRACVWVLCVAMSSLSGLAQSSRCSPVNPIYAPGAVFEFATPGPAPGCTYVYKISISAITFGFPEYSVYRFTYCPQEQLSSNGFLLFSHNFASSISNWYMSLCGSPVNLPSTSAPQIETAAKKNAVTTPSASGPAAQGFLTVDLNADGIPDAVLLNSQGLTVALLNQSGGTQSSNQFTTGFAPDYAYSTIVAADFNGDGKLDLAVSDPGQPGTSAGGVALLLGNGDGTFQAAKYFAAGQNPGSLAAADFNGDGKLDLAAASTSGATIAVLNGNGDGTFKAPVSYAAGGDSQATPASILALDLNGDGRPDLAVANQGFVTTPNSSISALLNTGSGFRAAFNAALPLPLRPDFLGYTDLNGDGHADLVAVSAQASALIVLNGNGDGTFQAPSAYATGNSPGSVGFIPIGDGSSLIVTADQTNGGVWQTTVSPSGAIGAPPFHIVGGAPTSVASADLNGDGQADAIVTGGSSDVSVLLSKSDVLQTPTGYSLGSPSPMPQAVAAGDLNHDGKSDVVVASAGQFGQPGLVSVLLGNGDGTLKTPISAQVSSGAQSIALADLNRDGKLDAVVAAYGNPAGTGGGGVIPLLGNGDGTFRVLSALSVNGYNPSSAAIADVNGDGIPDVAAVAITGANFGSGVLAVFLGNGDGTFQAAHTYALKAPAASQTKIIGTLSGIVVGDWNGDGKRDIAIVCQADGTSVDMFLGDGAGNFTEAALLPATADNPVSLSTADLNGDGKADLLIAHSGGEATFLLGNGDGTFQAEWRLPTGTSPMSLAVTSAATYNQILAADNVGALTSLVLPVSTASAPVVSATVSAASSSISSVAPASIATTYGSNLAASVGDTNTAVNVTDANGARQAATLFYTSPTQINFLIPASAALGTGQVTVATGAGSQASGPVTIANSAPSIFELNASGLAAAVVVVVNPDGTQSFSNVYQVDSSNNIVARPIDLNAGQVYLELYGTGLRGAANVSVTVGSQSVQVLSSGAQSTFPGLDQTNIGPIPKSMAGAGSTSIVLTGDSHAANTVNVSFK